MSSTGERIVLRGGRLLNPGDAAFAPADILIENGIVCAVTGPRQISTSDAVVQDVSAFLMHPGLINCHTHGHASLCKGMGDRWTLELLLAASVWTYASRELDDQCLSSTLAAVEMVLKGCTACYDLNMQLPAPTVEGIDAIARAYSDVGVRAVVAPAIADRGFVDAVPGLREQFDTEIQTKLKERAPTGGEQTLATISTAFRNWKYDREQIMPGIAPTIPMHCSDGFLRACGRIAEEYGLPIQSHIAESKVQAAYARHIYGEPIVHHLKRLGLLGPRFTVAHGVWLLPEEMELLGEAGSNVAHNPGSNLKIGSGLADARGMRNAGINIGIGTDGANCADHQNMYEALRLCSFVSRVQGRDVDQWLSTDEVWTMACLDGARLLGFEGRLGRIAPGFHADIVFLDAQHPNWVPLNNSINQLIHSEDGTAVHSVMVGGHMVVRDRRLLTLDMNSLARRADAARERLERLNVDNKHLFEALASVVNRFCPAIGQVELPINRFVEAAQVPRR